MRHVCFTPNSHQPIKPLWIGWIRIVMILFHPWRYGPRRERLNSWIYSHGPRELRRAYAWVGAAQNPDNLLGA